MNTRHRAFDFDLSRVKGEEKGTFYYNAIKRLERSTGQTEGLQHFTIIRVKVKTMYVGGCNQ